MSTTTDTSTRALLCAYLLAAAVGWGSPAILGAQGSPSVAKYCSSEAYGGDVPSSDKDAIGRMHPVNSRARYADMVLEQRWPEVLRGLLIEAEEAFAQASVSEEVVATFEAQADSVVKSAERLPSTNAPEYRGALDVLRPVRFDPVQLGARYQLFAGGPDALDLTDTHPTEILKALCWSALSFDQVLNRLARPMRIEARVRLARRNTLWRNYRSFGYTRQPLELLISPGSPLDTIPRGSQLLFLHLSGGVELGVNGIESTRATQAAVTEVIGLLWYRRDFTQYSGFSVVASAINNEPVGVGIMAHLARGVRLGHVWRRSDGKTMGRFLVSADLYGFLEHSKASVDRGRAYARAALVLPGKR
ncbi:MAG: hypothetical protein IPK33_08365 [Gemmatimonadetes bacterium]|nr:hypothetical protein [Gemmatimonadota bacterium]